MDARKRLVLKAIVDHYIRTGQPLSSQTLLEEYGLRVSSATIRNDMKVLEQQGLITKEYSSAGRIPTEKGFRFFVDWLIELSELAHHDQHAIMESYRVQRQEIERLLRQTALLLANLSGYAGFVLAPRLEEARLESIVFAKLDAENALAVVVSELGIIEHRVIPTRLADEELREISALLTEQLRGRRLDEVRRKARRYTEAEGWHDPQVQSAFTLLIEALEPRPERRLYVEGLFNLLRSLSEEGYQLGEVREVVRLLGDPQRFGRYLEAQTARSPDLQARIGSENDLPELCSCSLVFQGYSPSGALGVLGPIRMDYGKVFSITTYIGNRLQAILTLSHCSEEPLDVEGEVSPS